MKSNKKTAGSEASGNPYVPSKFRILKITKETHDTATFRIGCRTRHLPGQFMELSVFGAGECPISFCSYSPDYIEMCIRKVGNVTAALHRKKAGDDIWLRGPFGNGYPMNEMYGKDVCLVGGGTGVAPLRGALKYIESNREVFGKVSCYFGFRHPDDMLFKNDHKEWRKKFNLNITIDNPAPGWKGNVGFVASMIDKANINKDTSVIICGPPMMIKSVMQALQQKGVPEENVYISFERLMSCGIGKCGHCELGGKYVCKHGPVFRYDKAKSMMD